MSALILFVAAFCIVFALGFQSLNVNRGHYIAAAVTSLAIGTANLALLKIMPAQTTPLELAAYLGGGPLGIVASMWAHKRWMRIRQPLIDPAAGCQFRVHHDPDEAEAKLAGWRS